MDYSDLDAARVAHGFLTIGECLDLGRRIGALFDPYSTLLSRHARFGPGTVIYPGVSVECAPDARCEFGPDNVLYPGLRVTVGSGAAVVVGCGNRLGEGGARICADGAGMRVRIADRTRICDGAILGDGCVLGDGSQILGAISARAVRLAAGGDFTCPDPDLRGAVLKGRGTAHGLALAVGEVVNGNGPFERSPVERQRAYHPRAPHAAGPAL
jgi:acetyltransferase-like isoleucine patch superfamily enzyme